MTGRELKAWAATLSDECQVELNLQELAVQYQWHHFQSSQHQEWVQLEFEFMRSIQIPPERKARLVGERLIHGEAD